MYSSRLVYSDAFGEVSGTVEDAANGLLLLWENDFACSPSRRAMLIALTQNHMRRLGGVCKVHWGESRSEHAWRGVPPPMRKRV